MKKDLIKVINYTIIGLIITDSIIIVGINLAKMMIGV